MPIAAPFRKAVRALLRSTKHIELVDGVVLVDGQDVDVAVGSWCASDAAKQFLAPAGPGSGRAPTGKRRSEMDTSAKGPFIRLHGLAAYEQLPG